MKKRNFLVPVLLIFLALLSCNSNYTSKRTGYFRIDLPQKKYQWFDEPGFPYSFRYPVYAAIVADSTYFEANPENAYWRNIDFPGLGAKIFLSYKEVGGKALYKVKGPDGKYHDSIGVNRFDKMITDAFNLTNKNDDAATSKKDSLFVTPNGVPGMMFKLGGNAATARQFFVTDSVKNFLRGALYFYASPNADSVQPVLTFLQADMDTLLNSFRWKNTTQR